MPGSMTTPGATHTRYNAPVAVAFRTTQNVGCPGIASFAAQWLAYAHLYRRFAIVLANEYARLEADVVSYSFIVMDLHHLLLAGLPAHAQRSNPAGQSRTAGFWIASSPTLLAMTMC
ncbi:MAG: hypothetical protein FWG81_02545 [Betaproteobacteria bacterium]|nr:hypothetical protein [Betaproteobacteria bacterium]